MKRSHDSGDGDQRDASSAADGFNPKRRKQFTGGSKPKAKQGSLEFSRKRIRNIERLLRRNQELPADVQNELERELASLQATVSDRAYEKKRSAMISKYHMVRFFERKKASRLIKQLRNQIEHNPEADDLARLKCQLHIAEVDEAYAMYHPHLEPYVSLYKNLETRGESDDDGDEVGENKSEKEQSKKSRALPLAKASLAASRPFMWSIVEQTMERGIEALRQLRERRLAEDTARKPRIVPKKSDSTSDNKSSNQQKSGPMAYGKIVAQKGQKTQMNRRERRRLIREAIPANNSDEGEEDGGFFDEP